MHYISCICLLLIVYTEAETKFSRKPVYIEICKNEGTDCSTRHKREISTTRDNNGGHHQEVRLKVSAVNDDESHILELRLNEGLVSEDHALIYQQDGNTVVHKPSIQELDLCHYSGHVRGIPDSWVAVSTCHGVKGVIFDGKKMRYIEPAEGNEIQSSHYLYDHRDLNTEYRCGYGGGVTNNTHYDPELMGRYRARRDIANSRITRYKRGAEQREVRGPFNANERSRYVELVLVADHREFIANGESVRTVHSQMVQVANIINSVYTPLNIFIALVGVVVWNGEDKIQYYDEGDRTLTNFLEYREKYLNPTIVHDNAQLITKNKFMDGVVGTALKGTICTPQFSGGVTTSRSHVIGETATYVAHMLGHNLGMEHDTEVCSCPHDTCIMKASNAAFASTEVPTQWSSCSRNSLQLAFKRGMDYCLRNKPKRLALSPVCGNGFVEAGEQCDCGIGGGASGACAACCDPDTCMLRGNATCAVGRCCDVRRCRPLPPGTECRAAQRDCDLPEYCTGHSEFCPDDAHMMDSTPCGPPHDRAYCAHGSCRSHTNQCRILWGATGQNSNEFCYTLNAKGSRTGHCGYDKVSGTYEACQNEDILCGRLHCTHQSVRLELRLQSTSYLSSIYIRSNSSESSCQATVVDLGQNDVDPGFVPDGAKCGQEKMCMNHKCVPVSQIRESIAKLNNSVCPSNCSGHGVCNSKGHCHCEAGYSPPLCTLTPGGSYDSGPAFVKFEVDETLVHSDNTTEKSWTAKLTSYFKNLFKISYSLNSSPKKKTIILTRSL